MSKKEIDEISGVETTGHVWDDTLKELNTPLPRWWLWTYYACIVWAAGYAIAYPAWPTVKGLLGYSSRANVAMAIDEARAAQAGVVDQIASMDVGEILANDELARFARAAGHAAFKVNCIQCHGSGAAGSVGYPNLNDDEWIWGGTIEAIYTTIAHGARFEADDDTLISDMPAFGADDWLEDDQIKAAAAYVLSLSGGDADAALVSAGATVFEEECAACHGESGEGVPDLGGPSLNNGIWLYGDGGEEMIVAQIEQPQHGEMPAWSAKLGDTVVKELAVYVYSLGGGQ